VMEFSIMILILRVLLHWISLVNTKPQNCGDEWYMTGGDEKLTKIPMSATPHKYFSRHRICSL
jgi:hypothetical protein